MSLTILLMRKLRPNEVKKLTQNHTRRGETGACRPYLESEALDAIPCFKVLGELRIHILPEISYVTDTGQKNGDKN